MGEDCCGCSSGKEHKESTEEQSQDEEKDTEDKEKDCGC
ncbi:hypothetical protein BMS3Abin17_00262 [archaeon BMS3Abin17]|nr:hypothetical protein BMS3Abin17_00262 [archaeon BMS3Abin17]